MVKHLITVGNHSHEAALIFKFAHQQI